MPPHREEEPEPGDAPYFVRPKGRERGADGTERVRKHTSDDRSRASDQRPPSVSPGRKGPLRLTGRGGILLIALLSFAGAMLAHAFSWSSAPGFAFASACVLTAATVRPPDLLPLSVSPPLAFFVSVVAAEGVLAIGSEGFVRVLVLGLASRLAEAAPWLFLGTALVLIVAVFRGLPANIRELGDELNGRR